MKPTKISFPWQFWKNLPNFKSAKESIFRVSSSQCDKKSQNIRETLFANQGVTWCVIRVGVK